MGGDRSERVVGAGGIHHRVADGEGELDNQQGISIAKMVGFLKPKYNSIYDSNTVQDFGVLSVYVAQ
jgi:hypothetical protein